MYIHNNNGDLFWLKCLLILVHMYHMRGLICLLFHFHHRVTFQPQNVWNRMNASLQIFTIAWFFFSEFLWLGIISCADLGGGGQRVRTPLQNSNFFSLLHHYLYYFFNHNEQIQANEILYCRRKFFVGIKFCWFGIFVVLWVFNNF